MHLYTNIRAISLHPNHTPTTQGLVCNYIVARTPNTAPTSGRAVPVAIFSTEPAIARAYLRRWCGEIPDGRWLVPRVGVEMVAESSHGSHEGL